MAEKRDSRRVAFRNVVRFGPNDPPAFTSFATDLSETGLCIKTNNIFRPGTKLYIIIEFEGNPFKCEGVVMWAKKAPPQLVRHVKNGMGIEFTDVDYELIKVYMAKNKI
jgi:Tfp pilus assembly protein PilZ